MGMPALDSLAYAAHLSDHWAVVLNNIDATESQLRGVAGNALHPVVLCAVFLSLLAQLEL